MFLVPIDLHIDFNTRHAWVHCNVLYESGILEFVFNVNDSTCRTCFSYFYLLRLFQIPTLFVEFYFPGVLSGRFVDKCLKQVSARSRRQRFLSVGLVDQTSNTSCLWIDFHDQEFVFDCGAVDFQCCRNWLSVRFWHKMAYLVAK